MILLTTKADKNKSDCLFQPLELRKFDVNRDDCLSREQQLCFAPKYLTAVIQDAPARARIEALPSQSYEAAEMRIQEHNTPLAEANHAGR